MDASTTAGEMSLNNLNNLSKQKQKQNPVSLISSSNSLSPNSVQTLEASQLNQSSMAANIWNADGALGITDCAGNSIFCFAECKGAWLEM